MLEARELALQAATATVAVVAIAAVVTVLWTRRLAEPVRRLAVLSQRIAGGDYSARAPVHHQDEIGELTDTLNDLALDLEVGTVALEEARKQLVRQERLAVLGELSGSIAHELRNPLGVMRNSIYFLRMTRKIVDYKSKEHLSLLEEQIKRVDRIISELLDYARGPTSELERFVLQEAVDRGLENAKVPGTVVVERHFDELPVMVFADRDQIERTLANLVSNAVQAMPDGGKLAVECRRRSSEAVASVRDEGSGIAREDHSKIFEPLYTSKAKGIGLGLPLSQRYAQWNKGRLECESELGKGATFRLVLPLATAAGSS